MAKIHKDSEPQLVKMADFEIIDLPFLISFHVNSVISTICIMQGVPIENRQT